MKTTRRISDMLAYGNTIVMVLFASFVFLLPAGIVLYNLSDPAISNGQIPASAFRLHRSLSPRYEQWARDRIESERAAKLHTDNISGTEWPVFGSAFYLWATESLQDAWEKNPDLAPIAPKEYARGCIEAATDLIIDPNHATWVRDHWGDDYMEEENAFYRMLVVGSLTVHHKLTGDEQHLPYLREQVESLAADIDASPAGLLEDYPNECYPGDVVAAIACILRADEVLGTDHTAFAKRALRGFEGEAIDQELGIPPYMAVARYGAALTPARGCSNSYICLFAPEVWPEAAKGWYDQYEKHFWQHRWTASGFREFAKNVDGKDWYIDVDAGPSIAGHGFAASAFGAGAARANGRFDHAYPLTLQMLAASWPLPNGRLLLPRFLSNATDAPYLGEVGILFNLSRQPVAGVPITKGGGGVPGLVYVVFAIYLVGFALLTLSSLVALRHRGRRANALPVPRAQLTLWVVLVMGGLLTAVWIHTPIGVVMILCAQFLPLRPPRMGATLRNRLILARLLNHPRAGK
jgi:hypothetical protein